MGYASILVVTLSILSIVGSFNVKYINNYKLKPLYLFDFFKKKDSSPTSVSPPKVNVDTERVNALKGKLEKISNTQKRDYEAEAAARAPKPKELADKQIVSYNFNKPNEFPNLFQGWIKSDGDQIAKQMIASTKAALKTEKLIEIIFDPVPNLDEVAFGTVWNKKFRGDVVQNLQVPDFATNRGGPATLEWSNIYWANRLAEGLGSNSYKEIVALSISGEGTKGKFLPTLSKNLKLITLSDAKRNINTDLFSNTKMFILLSPCQESHYQDAIKFHQKFNVPVIALNSPYSYRYDLGGGKPFIISYIMKRIPKGWIYRNYPKDFEAIIEGPNYEVFRASSFKTQPTLKAISDISMQASMQKYGATGNDRIFEQRL